MSYPTVTRLGDKDAIHVCVQVVEAAHYLNPGQLVFICDGYASNGNTLNYHGVADPFKDPAIPIRAGDLFYVFMRPDVPRKLTHHWEDPTPTEPLPSEDQDECRNCYND